MSLQRRIQYSLSDGDIKRLGTQQPDVKGFSPCDIAIVTYEELEGKSLEQVLATSQTKTVVLLYQESPTEGHWTALFQRTPTTVCFFDPYGVVPDEQPKYMDSTAQKRFYRYRTLVEMLIHSPFKIDYNNVQLQKDGDDIATCGRHCLVRLWNRRKTTGAYAKWLQRLSKKYSTTPDVLVSLLT